MRQDDKKTPKGVQDSNYRSLFLNAIIKTTIYMFLPPLGLFGIGVAFDYFCKTTPIGMLIGVGVGFIIAIVLLIRLIRKQRRLIDKIHPENSK